MSSTAPPYYPGCVAPERSRRFMSDGVELNLIEWGDPEAPPVLMTHGMRDHAHCFDLLAPRLASHYRVVAMDARGHGDSQWVHAYRFTDDITDVVNVLRSFERPAHLIGHSRGGFQATYATALAPELLRQLVSLDGFGPPPAGFTVPGRPPNELDMDPAHRFEEYLDRRRSIGERLEWRPCESLDALVDRRISQTPRLSREWLTYFAYFGARKTAEGWRWKSDPLASWGFGPDKPDWIGPFWKHVTVPVLAVVGSVTDTWGPLPEPLLSQRLEHFPDCTRAVIDDAGHFMAIEEPKAVAELLLSFLDR